VIRRHAIALSLALLALIAVPTAAQAEFGIVPESLSVTALNEDGSFDNQAGDHPFSYTVHFDFNTKEGGQPDGEVRDILLEAPAGLVGNPSAIPACPRASFEPGLPVCKPNTQIGVLKALVPGFGQIIGPIYNLVPPPGTPVLFGFNSAAGLFALQTATVRTEGDYGVTLSAADLPTAPTSVTATIWGTPADPGHTEERGPETPGNTPSDAPLLPFLTLPTSCQEPPAFTVRVDSRQNPGTFIPETAFNVDKGGNPVALTGCEAVPFKPKVLSSPTTSAAGSSSGLGFELQLPNEGLLNPHSTAETQPLKTELTLPAAITANPAAASGLASCTPAQYKAASLTDPGCPEASKLGTLVVHTPLLPQTIEGSLYLATPHNNPFNSLIALYITAKDPISGIVVKQAARVEVDPQTGQLTTIVDHLPPVPYSSFEVRLREGPRAPLITPQTCGKYESVAKLYPFSDPANAVVKTAPFTISSGAGGGACATTEAQLPFAPTMAAGTTTPIAGAYAPFVFKISRADSDQRLDSVSATLPRGLVGKLAGVAECSDAQIAAAAARSNEGEGILEATSPSCPPASQVGIVNVGAGAGSQPLYVQGKAYLAGPYKGAPLSMAIITPAIAGPFDLGVVVVRAALYVNEESAQITVKSDPLPRILHGLPLDVRSASVQVDRDQFTLNPTNCEELAVSAQAGSVTGATANLQNRFQVGGCAALPYTPKLELSLKGGTRRAQHPALRAVLTQPKGQANSKRVSVMLPSSEFIDQDHVGNPCTRPKFAEEKCPKISELGTATAYSPLLDAPLKGKVYFRANGGVRDLPDIVIDLKGKIHLTVVGFVDSVHRKGSEESRIRNTLALVPDAPVSKFVLALNRPRPQGRLRRPPGKLPQPLRRQEGHRRRQDGRPKRPGQELQPADRDQLQGQEGQAALI